MFGRGGKRSAERVEPRFEGSPRSRKGDDLRADPDDRPAPPKKTAARKSGSGRRAARPKRSLIGRLFYWSFVLGVWGVIALAGLVAYYASQLPPIDQLAVPKRPPNIAVLAADGSLLANRGDTGGAAVRLSELPPYLPKAFVAIEDRRFYSHFGIDPVGISRAIVRDVARRGRHARRLDAHPATREEPVPDAGAHAVAQNSGGDPRALARAQIFQGSDPRALSQSRLFRLGRLWRRGGGAEVFRQERQDGEPLGGGRIGGIDEVAGAARPHS